MDGNLTAAHRDDWTKWTDESSGAYTKYVSIDEEGSVKSAKAVFTAFHIFVISGINHT